MDLSQAIEIIEKSQADICDKIFLGEEPYPPDEYFLAVAAVLPYLRCLNCMAKQSVKDTCKAFISVCNSGNSSKPNADEKEQQFISPELNPEELPFG